ncbi:hypothetical protein [Methylomarinum vadi]|uniref:hypothetical protein n=1 Tax=Methylomarinum vadi TaxID=438855 RepID=UPI00055E1EFC|nr:hypothetical protein [Methylomarinum vadi]
MIPALQKITILLLVLLQLAAPLVHAHSGRDTTGLGVHVPGLESWSVGATQSSFSSCDKPYHTDNYIVSVSSAIKQKPTVSIEPSYIGALPHPLLAYTVAQDATLLNFSPHIDLILPSPPRHSHATRAPPFSYYIFI